MQQITLAMGNIGKSANDINEAIQVLVNSSGQLLSQSNKLQDCASDIDELISGEKHKTNN